MSHLADAQSYLIDAEDAIANGQPGQTWLELSRIHALIAIAEHGAPASASQPEPPERSDEESSSVPTQGDLEHLHELIGEIQDEFHRTWNPGQLSSWLENAHLARRLLEAGYRATSSRCPIPDRILVSEEELNALPDGSVVVDRFGDGGTVRNNTVQYHETAPTSTAYAIKHYGPFTLVWQPPHDDRS